jgi:hypothetical protein
VTVVPCWVRQREASNPLRSVVCATPSDASDWRCEPTVLFTNDNNYSKPDLAINSTLSVQPNSVEFTTTSGKRIKASW